MTWHAPRAARRHAREPTQRFPDASAPPAPRTGSAFLGGAPKDRRPRFDMFVVPAPHQNPVLLVADTAQPLDTHSLHHLDLAAMPADQEPVYRVPRTAPGAAAASWATTLPCRPQEV